MNPIITELAKNLILSGINLIIFDKQFENDIYSNEKTVKKDDYERNYLIREDDNYQNVILF